MMHQNVASAFKSETECHAYEHDVLCRGRGLTHRTASQRVDTILCCCWLEHNAQVLFLAISRWHVCIRCCWTASCCKGFGLRGTYEPYIVEAASHSCFFGSWSRMARAIALEATRCNLPWQRQRWRCSSDVAISCKLLQPLDRCIEHKIVERECITFTELNWWTEDCHHASPWISARMVLQYSPR